MKIVKSPPQNQLFFSEHGPSYRAYGTIGFIGQLLSGLSLGYAVYRLLLTQIYGEAFTGNTVFVTVLAMLTGFFIELANRVLARRAIKPMVVKDQFTDDTRTQARHRVLNRSYLVLLITVALLSYLFSTVGSRYYAEDRAPSPTLIDQDSIQQHFKSQETALKQAFKADTALVAPAFALRLKAAHERFKADSLALRKERSRYLACAQRGNQWCKSKLTAYLADIDHRRSEWADSVATISREKLITFSRYQQKRDRRLNGLQAERSNVLKSAAATNATLSQEAQSSIRFQGLIFIILTVAGQTLFYGMVYLQLQIEAGSEIEFEAIPNEFWAQPSILDELKTTIAWRLERGLRRLIRQVFKEPQEHDTSIPYRALNTTSAHTPTPSGARSTHQSSCAVKDTPEQWSLSDVKQRLKQYKKRLGSHQQKAIQQERKTGEVTPRTQKAIENNTRWVAHYSELLKILTQPDRATQNGVHPALESDLQEEHPKD